VQGDAVGVVSVRLDHAALVMLLQLQQHHESAEHSLHDLIG
jgi:hypothetical protein